MPLIHSTRAGPFPASAWGRRRFPVVQANAPRGVSLPQFVGVVQVRLQWASRRGHLPGRSERIWLRHGVLAIGRRLSGRAEGHGGSRVISDALWWQRTGPWNGGAPTAGRALPSSRKEPAPPDASVPVRGSSRPSELPSDGHAVNSRCFEPLTLEAAVGAAVGDRSWPSAFETLACEPRAKVRLSH